MLEILSVFLFNTFKLRFFEKLIQFVISLIIFKKSVFKTLKFKPHLFRIRTTFILRGTITLKRIQLWPLSRLPQRQDLLGINWVDRIEKFITSLMRKLCLKFLPIVTVFYFTLLIFFEHSIDSIFDDLTKPPGVYFIRINSENRIYPILLPF